MTIGALAEIPPVAQIAQRAGEAADCYGGQLCRCVRHQQIRAAGESLRLDRLNGEIPATIRRLLALVGDDDG